MVHLEWRVLEVFHPSANAFRLAVARVTAPRKSVVALAVEEGSIKALSFGRKWRKSVFTLRMSCHIRSS